MEVEAQFDRLQTGLRNQFYSVLNLVGSHEFNGGVASSPLGLLTVDIIRPTVSTVEMGVGFCPTMEGGQQHGMVGHECGFLLREQKSCVKSLETKMGWLVVDRGMSELSHLLSCF